MSNQRFENGVHDIENSTYHAAEGISRSALMTFRRSPLHYYHKYISESRVQDESTPAMILGSLVHCLVLEPEKFYSDFVVLPNLDRRTKFGKAEYERIGLESIGRQLIAKDLYDKACAMNISVRAELEENDLVAPMLAMSQVELSIFFGYDGIQYKCRPDSWCNTVIFDLKTTNDASPRAFKQSAYNYGYYLQAAMARIALTTLGVKMSKFVCVAVEKEFPYATGIYVFDESAINYGLDMFYHLHKQIKEAIFEENFPGFGVQNIGIPGFAKYDDCYLTGE